MSRKRRRKPKKQRLATRIKRESRKQSKEIIGHKPDEGPYFIGIATHADGHSVKQYILSEWGYEDFMERATGARKDLSPLLHTAKSGVNIQIINDQGRHFNKATLLKFFRDEQAKKRRGISLTDYLKAWGLNIPWERKEWYDRIEMLDGSTIRLLEPPNLKEFKEKQETFKSRGIPNGTTTLYHGTYAGNIPSILSGNFKLPRWGGAFGRGIYMGRIDKARNYARPMRGNSRYWGYMTAQESAVPDKMIDSKFILQVEALLGNIHKPVGVCGGEALKQMKEAGCQSVTYSFIRQEWVVYDPNQILITKIIKL